jgi:hypothetical protein
MIMSDDLCIAIRTDRSRNPPQVRTPAETAPSYALQTVVRHKTTQLIIPTDSVRGEIERAPPVKSDNVTIKRLPSVDSSQHQKKNTTPKKTPSRATMDAMQSPVIKNEVLVKVEHGNTPVKAEPLVVDTMAQASSSATPEEPGYDPLPLPPGVAATVIKSEGDTQFKFKLTCHTPIADSTGLAGLGQCPPAQKVSALSSKKTKISVGVFIYGFFALIPNLKIIKRINAQISKIRFCPGFGSSQVTSCDRQPPHAFTVACASRRFATSCPQMEPCN